MTRGRVPAALGWALLLADALAAAACAQPPTARELSALSAAVDAETWSSLLARARAHQRRCGIQVLGATGPLQWNDAVARAAQGNSTDMAATRTLSHTGSRGEELGRRLRSAGYRPRAWGENLAYGQPDPESVLSAWLDSPGHCRNIMDPTYRQFGAARARGEDRQAAAPLRTVAAERSNW